VGPVYGRSTSRSRSSHHADRVAVRCRVLAEPRRLPGDGRAGSLHPGCRGRRHHHGCSGGRPGGGPGRLQVRRLHGQAGQRPHIPVRPEADLLRLLVSARTASYSSSDSKGSTSAAKSSTEEIGLTPCRRARSSVGTKSSADKYSGCSGVLFTVTTSDPIYHPTPAACQERDITLVPRQPSCASPRLNTVEVGRPRCLRTPAAILEAGFHLDGMQRR
jgi:hypothetical protein